MASIDFPKFQGELNRAVLKFCVSCREFDNLHEYIDNNQFTKEALELLVDKRNAAELNMLKHRLEIMSLITKLSFQTLKPMRDREKAIENYFDKQSTSESVTGA